MDEPVSILMGIPQVCSDVPLPASADKLHESMYFYAKMTETYHEPEVFRFNLNAFIQSIRSVRDILRREMGEKKVPYWRSWMTKAEQRLDANTLLGKFHNLRNFIVNEGMLRTKSQAFIGAFKYRQEKLGFLLEVNPFDDSRLMLQRALDVFAKGGGGFGILASHPFLGEEYGVLRTWVVEELGDDDATEYCRRAFDAMQCVTSQAIGFAGGHLSTHDLPNAKNVRLLTETDVDPTLVEKWGW